MPSPSGVALQLLHLVGDDAATIDQITSTLESDPAIASRLLKLVNAPLMCATRTVASVSTAVKLVGMHAVKNLALGVSLLSDHKQGVSKLFDYDRFWSKSLARAVMARNLSNLFKCCPPDEAFTVALLSGIGRLALATVFPKEYDELLANHREASSSSLAEAEQQAFNIHYCHLAADMMADWGLPDVFCESVRRLDSIAQSASVDDSRISTMSRLLQLADVAASVLAKPKVYREDLNHLLNSAEGMGLNADEFSDRFDVVRKEWREVATIFSVHAAEAPSLRDVHTRASRGYGSVLVVDDDPTSLRILTKFLTEAGYDVLTATNGVEALQIINAEGCQLIITDWVMPEMDGLDLCLAIRSSEGIGATYIIILTGFTDGDSLVKAFNAGADDYLTKPCRQQELIARLQVGVRALTSEAKVASQQLAIRKTNAELATLNGKLHQMATIDELTGLYNRREGLRRLKEYWDASERSHRPLACMMIDVDHFKQCNDRYGHDVGDAVLRETAHILKRGVRAGETVFRMGGEEFVVLCPGSVAGAAAEGAERLRAAVEANRIKRGGTKISVNISVGVAEKSSATLKPDDLLRNADEALYESKRGGRNRVWVSGDGEFMPPTQSSGDGSETAEELALTIPSPNEEDVQGVVLVVDDDRDVRRLFRTLLERDGFQVQEACDGIDALAKMAEVHPQVILIDVEMPNMNGFDCTRKIKSDPTFRHIPVIIVSGKADSRDVRAGLDAGAQEYITKPINRDEFLLRVRAMYQLCRDQAYLLESNSVRGEQARAMGILFDLSRSLAEAHSLEEIVAQTTVATSELLNSRRVSVMLPDETGENLYVANAIGIDDRLAAKILVPVGSAIAGTVYASGKPMVFNSQSDITECTRRYDSDFFASVPLASKVLSVPNKVVGVLNVTERHAQQPFEAHELEYLDLVCNMTASSLEQLQSWQARKHAHAALVIGLAKLAEYRDGDTGKHLERVTQFALLLARELRKKSGFSETIDDRFLSSLEQAAPLHDIGKVAVPDAILLKHGPLTDTEFSMIKRHTDVGARAIQSMIEQAPEADFLVMAKNIAYGHHEWYDGSGYPDGMSGDDIPLSARIVAVADVYDALTNKRPYKVAFSHEKSLDIIREASGIHFDPAVVDVFLTLERRFAELAQELRDESEDAQGQDGDKELVALDAGAVTSTR